MSKKLVLLSSVGLLGAIAVTYTQCGNSPHLTRYFSKQEQQVYTSKVFAFYDPKASTSVVEDTEDFYDLLWNGTDVTFDLGDSYIPNNPFKGDADKFQWVARCNMLEEHPTEKSRTSYINSTIAHFQINPADIDLNAIKTSYDLEKELVLRKVDERLKAIANGANLPKLIPVEYSFSTGDKHDGISFMAYRRSILRSDFDGTSYIEAANKTYEVSAVEAKKDFTSGKMQYFSLVEVKKESPSSTENYNNFIAGQPFDNHSSLYMHKSSELPEEYNLPKAQLSDYKIARLVIADLRDSIIPTTTPLDIMYADVASVGRNNEVSRNIKDTFNLKNIYQHRDIITTVLSLDRRVSSQGATFDYKAYDSAAQVIQRLNCDVGTSRITSSSYTPIVLDLGQPYIRTSSTFWGSFFNLGNGRVIKNAAIQEPVDPNTYTHRSSWIGGYMKEIPNKTADLIVPNSMVVPTKYWRRVAEDGFLTTKKSGLISASDLFGTFFGSDHLKKFDNGFQALQEYAGTKEACALPLTTTNYIDTPTEKDLEGRYTDIKKRFLGPWHPKYEDLRIWIDANMDGVSDAAEFFTLKEVGVLAINTCLGANNKVSEIDQYGNSTHLRSSFLYDMKYKSAAMADSDIDDILYQIAMGKNKNKEETHFRALIDIFFKARPTHFLERSLKYRETSEGGSFSVDIMGESVINGSDDVEIDIN